MTKSQSAAEYTVILAIVLVISVVAIAASGVVPSTSESIFARSSNVVSQGNAIGIFDYIASFAGTSFDIQNNLPNGVSVTSIYIDDKPFFPKQRYPLLLAPGESMSLNGYTPSESGISTVNISYVEDQVGATVTQVAQVSYVQPESTIADNQLLRLHLDQSPHDYAGSNDYDSMVSEVLNVTGIFGRAYNFDGDADYIDYETGVSVNDSFSASAWIKIDEFKATYYGAIVSQDYTQYGTANPVMDGFGLHIGDIGLEHGILRFYCMDLSASEVRTSPTLNTSQWYMLSATFNGSQRCVYLDGKVSTCSTITCDYKGDPSGNFRVGNNPEFSINRQDFNGTLDEVMVWDTALTAEQIAELYAFGIQ